MNLLNERETRLMPAIELGPQYYICCPGYILPDARPDPLQFLYGESRLMVFNLDCTPLWLFYMWLCDLARRAEVFYLFTEKVTQESCSDRWGAISVLMQLCAIHASSVLVTGEIYQNRAEAMERINAQ